jgi:hypothetical protein
MKTTIEIPDVLFRKAKATAASRGQSLKSLVIEALQDKLSTNVLGTSMPEPPWMRGFGKLRHLRNESARIRKEIEETFEVIEPEDRL